MMSGSKDSLIRFLAKDNLAFGRFNRSDRRFGTYITHFIIHTSRVVFRPCEIVIPISIEYMSGLAVISVVLYQQPCCIGFYGYHIIIQFTYSHVIISPVQISLATDRIGKDIRVYILSSGHTLGAFFINQRFSGIYKRSGRMIGDCYSDLLLGCIIVIIFVTAVLLFLFNDTGSPCILLGP